MSDRFVTCFSIGWTAEAAITLVREIGRTGLSLANPETHEVVALSSEMESMGERLIVDRAELLDWMALRDRDEQNGQLWIDGTRDVVFRVMRRGGLIVQDFYLDGLDLETTRSAASRIVSVVGRPVDGLLGLVVDLTGRSVESDWEGVIRGRAGRVDAIPDLLILRPEAARRLGSAHGVHPSEWQKMNGLFSLDRAGLLAEAFPVPRDG